MSYYLSRASRLWYAHLPKISNSDAHAYNILTLELPLELQYVKYTIAMGVAYCLNVRKILNLPDSKHRR